MISNFIEQKLKKRFISVQYNSYIPYNPYNKYKKLMINNKKDQLTPLQKLVLSKLAEKDNKNKVNQFELNKQEQKQAQELFNELEISPNDQDVIIKQQQISEKSESQNQEKQSKSVNIEQKIKSILKNSDFKSRIEEKSKKVTFIDPKDKKENKKEYIVLGTTRKWGQKLKSPRKGKFDPQQRRTLIQNLSQCLRVQNLTYDQIVKSMSQDDQKIPRNLQFWTKVCSVLPDRTIVSSYKFLKRQLSDKNKGGQWKEDQVALLEQLVKKYGRKWSMIAKQMHRTSENIRDKYRVMGQQKYDPSKEQTVWKFEQLVTYLRYLQKYSKINFLKEQLFDELQNAQKHDETEQKQMKQRKYNSKAFIFHNNQIVRKYIDKQFNQIKVDEVNWQKLSDKMQNKTIFDCRNKFIQLLQLEIYGGGSKQFYQKEIIKFIIEQNPKCQNDISWKKWNNEQINAEEARNRWMILKRHIQGRGQKTFNELLQQIKVKFNIN